MEEINFFKTTIRPQGQEKIKMWLALSPFQKELYIYYWNKEHG